MAEATRKKSVLPEMVHVAKKVLRKHPDLCSISINTAAENFSFDLKQFVADMQRLKKQLDAPVKRAAVIERHNRFHERQR